MHTKKQIVITFKSGKTSLMTEDVTEEVYLEMIDGIKNFINQIDDGDQVLTFKTESDQIYAKRDSIACIILKKVRPKGNQNLDYEIVTNLNINSKKPITFCNDEIQDRIEEFEEQIHRYMEITNDNLPFLILETTEETIFLNNDVIESVIIRNKGKFKKGNL